MAAPTPKDRCFLKTFLPETYDIQALLTLDAGTVQSITGVLPSTDEITFNASVANVLD